VLNVQVVPFAKSITIDPLTAFDEVSESESCAVTVRAASFIVIAPPALNPVWASVAVAVPLPPCASCVVPL
jgi:hypothetical protein